MRPDQHWIAIEKRTPIAVRVSHDFIKSLIDRPSKYTLPMFSAETGSAVGVRVTAPYIEEPVDGELGDWIVRHPDGTVEALDSFTFEDTYARRD